MKKKKSKRKTTNRMKTKKIERKTTKKKERNYKIKRTSRTEFGLWMRSPAYLCSFAALSFIVLYCYYVKVAKIVIHSCFRPLSIAILVKNGDFARFQLVCDGRTDGPTDRRTDGPTDGRTHPLIEMRERI